MLDLCETNNYFLVKAITANKKETVVALELSIILLLGHSTAAAYQLLFGFQPGSFIQQQQALLSIIFFSLPQMHSRGNSKCWENWEESLQ